MTTVPTPRSPDQDAAHEFLCELRTRITTQPLPYQYGVEATALESLRKVFDHAREIMKKHPGCRQFAAATTQMLNADLRPVTAKWHRALQEGRLNSRDGGDEFRDDLVKVQDKLRDFAEALHCMAYGTKYRDKLTPPALDPADLQRYFEDMNFGIPGGPSQMNEDEEKEVDRRRKKLQVSTPEGVNAVGLAFSGGGIRSATFCLGVTQVLAKRNLLKDVDFLSTVSGGGYTGSFLTARLGVDTTDQAFEKVGSPDGPDPDPVRYVRHHARFLSPTNLKDGWSMAASTVAGMVLNWCVPLLCLAIITLVTIALDGVFPTSLWRSLMKISAVLTGTVLVVYCGLLRGGEQWRIRGAWLLGVFSAITALVGACWIIDIGNFWIESKLQAGPAGTIRVGITGLIGFLITAAPAVVRFVPFLRNDFIRKIALKLLLRIAGLVIPILAILSAYILRYVGRLPELTTVSGVSINGLTILAGFIVTTAIITLLLNVNMTSPHRIYRDRLAKTFVQSQANSKPVELAAINAEARAPYHLINTALNIPSSDDPALRGRKSTFFMFSKHWSGSATTGYHKTSEWKMNGQPADLATAMAISGAAASAHMGLLSQPMLVSLLTVLNVRMGFWIKSPGKKSLFANPGFICLLRELSAMGMSENSAWLNLSDGGHIENLAIYELLRRRCKFIICVDGEADHGFSFGGLMTLVRHAQIDHGIRIEPNTTDISQNSKTLLSQTHSLLCRIYYPETAPSGKRGIGLLLYLKLSLTGNEPELITRYRARNADFPHESTADQFFDEEQFEAYRQLGVHVAEGLFSHALMGDTDPQTVHEWFLRLSQQLLQPEMQTP